MIMHPFKKLCKHAQYEIGRKGSYSQKEKDEASGLCWKCDKPLTELKAPVAVFDDDLKRRMSEDEKLRIEVMERVNVKRYECVPCFTAMLEEGREGPFVSLEEVRKQLLNPDEDEKRREKIELIKEVEMCGPDCPYWDRLTQWKKDIGV